jgi:hypothetical protein
VVRIARRLYVWRLAELCGEESISRQRAVIPVSATLWPQLSSLLDQALDLPADERAAWLEDLRRQQPSLQPVIQQLLAAHAKHETGDFLNQGPTLLVQAYGPAARDESAEQLQVGDAIGPYRLLRALGSGARWR